MDKRDQTTALRAMELASNNTKAKRQAVENEAMAFTQGFASCALFFLSEGAEYPALFREGELSEEDLRYFGNELPPEYIKRTAEDLAMCARLKRDQAKTD